MVGSATSQLEQALPEESVIKWLQIGVSTIKYKSIFSIVVLRADPYIILVASRSDAIGILIHVLFISILRIYVFC